MAPGRRTVSSILRVLGLSGLVHFQNYHRVLNRAQWSALGPLFSKPGTPAAEPDGSSPASPPAAPALGAGASPDPCGRWWLRRAGLVGPSPGFVHHPDCALAPGCRVVCTRPRAPARPKGPPRAQGPALAHAGDPTQDPADPLATALGPLVRSAPTASRGGHGHCPLVSLGQNPGAYPLGVGARSPGPF